MNQKLDQILSEPELLQYLGLSKSQLFVLREEGLRYIRVNRNVKLYAESSVTEFLMAREMRHVVQHKPVETDGE